jgi:phosphatidylglycerol:prolipoprotein diacylglycerol transferase
MPWKSQEATMPTAFEVGPFTIHYYSLVILVGIIMALLLTGWQVRKDGRTLDFLLDAVPWIFLGAILGARIWHIFTPPDSMVARGITTRYYLTHLLEALAIWKGGVGIIGAILGGSLALWIYAQRVNEIASDWLDILAPGSALAQAFGRWGNYINQEVYGLPSNLPWAITIDPQHRLPGFSQIATYHPLFVYESLWSLLNLAFLLWIKGRYGDKLKSGSLFLVYLIFYGIGRVGLEFLRLDISSWQGVDLNQTAMSLVVIIASFLLYNRQRRDSEEPELA